MPSTRSRTVGDFVSLFQYTHWANDRMLTAMQNAGAVPERAVELFSHLLRAQDMWYGRVEDTEHTDLALWDTDSLEACAERLDASTQRWHSVLESRAADDLDRPVTYTNTSGTVFETPLRDLLSHVVNHGTHHRAQIALVLRESDIAPPATDYIFYLRDE